MHKHITLGHGSGGKLTSDLVKGIFASAFGMNGPLTDSAVTGVRGEEIAFTTDSYVVDPIFFPGGDIGKLAVCGTVNDLAVAGAVPLSLAASFIIEEGFETGKLETIAGSMAAACLEAGVKIVTGDTKVVEKGKCDGVFITTTGIGLVRPEYRDIGTGRMVAPGDILIVSGPLGNHSIAVTAARKQLSFVTDIVSDCAPLNKMIGRLLDAGAGIRFMRDLTRGGLATVLNELAEMTGFDIYLEEPKIPVDEPVKGVCEMLGFDPLYLANEGKILLVVSQTDATGAIGILRSDPYGKNASVAGHIKDTRGKTVEMKTAAGGTRILNQLSGVQLPRIC